VIAGEHAQEAWNNPGSQRDVGKMQEAIETKFSRLIAGAVSSLSLADTAEYFPDAR
jgi:hypothetical protein